MYSSHRGENTLLQMSNLIKVLQSKITRNLKNTEFRSESAEVILLRKISDPKTFFSCLM